MTDDNVIDFPKRPAEKPPEKLTKMSAWCTKCHIAVDITDSPTFIQAWMHGHGHICNCFKDIA